MASQEVQIDVKSPTDTAVEAKPEAKVSPLSEFLNSPIAIPLVFAVGALIFSFWDLLKGIPNLWFADEYYSHGFLVPLISGYVIYKWWPKIRTTEIKPNYWLGVPLLLICMVIGLGGLVAETTTVQSIALVGCTLAGVILVAGLRWMFALFLPIAYLGFCLPILNPVIEEYTNPLQVISTKVSYAMLEAAGFAPYRGDATTIYLNHFTLDVGGPCSGLKLVVALTSFVVFFMMIAKLKPWANITLAIITFPLAILLNGLRISMIGVVGDSMGADAGHKFHDYSGYLTLIICFLVLFKIVRLLGWKD